MNLLNLPMKNALAIKKIMKKDAPKQFQSIKQKVQEALPKSISCLHQDKRSKVKVKVKVDDEEGNEQTEGQGSLPEQHSKTSKQNHKKNIFAGFSALERSLQLFAPPAAILWGYACASPQNCLF